MISTSREEVLPAKPEACVRCGAADLSEQQRRRTTARLERVVYVKQRIKHFNREGSEYWTEMEVPDLVEAEVAVDELALECSRCGHVQRVRVQASG